MSVFVDTAVFYAVHDRDAPQHETAKTAFERVLDGEFGRPCTSDYVYDEAVTLMRSRTGRFQDAKTLGDRIRGIGEFSGAVVIFHLSEADFEAAVETFERYADHPLSFTDATTVALVERRDVDAVLSFDDDFDGIVERLDPQAVA